MFGKDKSKNKTKSISLFALTFLCVLFFIIIGGLSYAFLSQVLKGEKENTVTAGTLAIEYKDKKTINLDNVYPMSDQRGMMTESYEFSVENTGDVKAIYDISLEEDKSTMNHSYLKYALKRNNEEWSEPKVLDSLKLREQIELEVGSKDNYELKLWMDEKVGNEGQNKIFKARVVISSVQSNATAKDVTPPVIKLKGSLSENIEQNSEYNDPGVESVVDDKDTLDKNDITLSYEYYDGENTTEVENIDTSKLGVYYITYQITDKNGNIGKVIRSVNIYKKNTTPPVMKLNGKNLMAIKTGEEYTELGASATSGEKDLTSRIVTVGKVNNKKAGSYEIKYLITDNDGNTVSIVRVVNVIHITSDIKADITLDLTEKPTDKIKIEGENLGDITYISNDPDIVTVDENGNVTGKNPGTTTITIKTSTGHEETITITVTKTVTVTFVKQGSGVTSIKETSKKCSITEKNGSCNITLPDMTVNSGYTKVGWSEEKDAHEGSSVGSSINITTDKKYYSISYKNEIIYKVNFNANGNTISDTSKSCTIEKAYNSETQGTSCTVTTPTITAPSATPTIVGYNQDKTATTSQIGSNASLTVTPSINGKTYYAITKKEAVTRSITYTKQGTGVTAIGKTSDSCTIGTTYNGTSQGTSCNVVAPSITVSSGYTAVGWNTNKDATSGISVNGNIALSGNATYYSISYKNAITYTVNFNANGNTIAATSKTCTIAATYNNTTQATSCILTTPTITAPSATPTIVGYSQDKTATTSQIGSNTSLTVTSSINGKTYYAITKKDGRTITITFNKNGASTQTNASGTAVGDATVTRSCSIATVYNGTTQASSCNVTSPTIVGSSNTPTVIGYSAATGTHTSSWSHNTAKAVSTNATYYAQTTKGAVTRSITYTKQGTGVTAIGKTNDSCTIGATYNGTSQGTSCNVVAPSITVSSGYTAVGWNTNKDATSGISVNGNIALSGNATYYSISYKNAITYTVNFNANKNTINATSKSCTISAAYNNTTQATSCTVTTPTITAPSATPTIVGYNQTSSATSSQVGSNATLSVNSSINGKTYYAITKKDGRTITITFNKNGAGTQTNASGTAVGDATVTRSCSIATVYNGASQAGSCNVTSPTIVGTSNTPTVIGYSTATGTHTSSWNHNTEKAVSANATYYAQTKKDGRTIIITFNKNGASTQTNPSGTAVSDATVTRSCSIATVYNGASQAGSCNVTSPTIVGTSNTPTVIGYSTATGTHTSSWNHNTEKAVSANATYYAQTKKDGFSRNISYYAWKGVDDYGDGGAGGNSSPFNVSSCNIATVYNGTSQATSCNITLITAREKTGYQNAKWYTNSNGTGTSYASGSTFTLDGKVTFLYGIAQRNFTCAATGGTTTYGKRSWYTVANDGTNCTLALNELSASTGTYSEATTKLTTEYFKDDPMESTLLSEKNAGLTTVLGTYTAGTGIPTATTGVIWTGASSAAGVNRTFPYYTNKTAGLYYSSVHVTDGVVSGKTPYSNFITGYNTLSTSTCSSVSGSNCVINNGKVTTYSVSNHASTDWTMWDIMDLNSTTKFTVRRQKATNAGTTTNNLGQYSLYLYDCGGARHNNVSYSIIAKSTSSVKHTNYFSSSPSVSNVSAINNHYWIQAGVAAGSTSTVTNGTQRVYMTGTDASCVPTYTTAYQNVTYPIQYRLYIKVKM